MNTGQIPTIKEREQVMKIGYARVSSYGQSLEVQRQKLKDEGCSEIFEEKISALSQKRTELDNALRTIREGDVLIVTKLDRLARSMQDLLTLSKRLQKKQAELKVLDQSIDTTTSEGRLMFNIIGSFAEFEHDIRKARQMDGIRKAKDKGVAFGRKHVLNEQQQQEIVRLNKDESFSLNQLATKYAVSHMTIYRVIKKMDPPQETHQDLQWVA
ncbi:MAG: recombinase family protein [Candidatus Rhabdochlamydia sp.]